MDLDKYRMNAITMGNALIFTSPSTKKKQVYEKQRQWRQFVDGLDWEKLEKRKEKPSPKKVASMFRALGVPVRIRKKKKE